MLRLTFSVLETVVDSACMMISTVKLVHVPRSCAYHVRWVLRHALDEWDLRDCSRKNSMRGEVHERGKARRSKEFLIKTVSYRVTVEVDRLGGLFHDAHATRPRIHDC